LRYSHAMNPAVLSSSSSIAIAFLASVFIYIMFLGLLFLWLIDGRIKKEQVLHALMAVGLVWVFTEVIKSLLPIPRPFLNNGFPPLTLTIPQDHSFPSFHAAAAFALSTSIWLHDKKTGIWFILFAAIVAWGRILGNVHYLGDVLVGILIGIMTANVIEKLHLGKFVK